MLLGTSAVLAILLGKPERRSFLESIESADRVRMSVANFVETSMVIEARYGSDGLRDLDRLLARAAVEILPVGAQQGQHARQTFNRVGKGRHRAALKFGDCFAYAAAIA